MGHRKIDISAVHLWNFRFDLIIQSDPIIAVSVTIQIQNHQTLKKSLKFHREFSWATFKNDICVLKLKENIGHLINHQYPCLPAADYQFADGNKQSRLNPCLTKYAELRKRVLCCRLGSDWRDRKLVIGT